MEDEEAGATADGADAAALVSGLYRWKGVAVTTALLLVLLFVLCLVVVVVLVAGGCSDLREEKEGGRCWRDARRESIPSRIPFLVSVEVEVKIPVAPAVAGELDSRREPNVGLIVTDAAASAAAAAVLDEPPPCIIRPALLVPAIPSPPSPPPSPPPPPPFPLAAAAFAVGADAAVAAAVLASNLVEGSPEE